MHFEEKNDLKLYFLLILVKAASENVLAMATRDDSSF